MSAKRSVVVRPGSCPRCGSTRRKPGRLYCPIHEAVVRVEMIQSGYLVEIPRTKASPGEGEQ